MKVQNFDASGDGHYDLVSAFQKSIRGSDTDAALHYLARLIESGDLISSCSNGWLTRSSHPFSECCN